MDTLADFRVPRWFGERMWRRWASQLERALAAARTGGETTLASVTAECDAPVDPVAVVAASRRSGEPWFCFEQPERQASALAALGSVFELSGGKTGRFAPVVTRWQALIASGHVDPPAAAPGSGPVLVGALPFAAGGCRSAVWAAFADAGLVVPELSLARRGERAWLTVCAAVAPDDMVEHHLTRTERRLQELIAAPLPLFDPPPVGAASIRSVMPPAHYEEAVARAAQWIRRGKLEKVVLAREVEVDAPAPPDPAALLGLLRDAFPSCLVYAVGRGPATFLGASPELLVRREGGRASTVALAGSTRRSADPAVDDHLGEALLRSVKDREENAVVARRILRALRPHSVWVTAAPEPALVKVANVQHLGTPIRAQLARSIGVIELADLLHPTPAVGGEPWPVAESLIPALEGFDRGCYAGPVGWADATGDGEFCVALRCALLQGCHARLFAGAGIMGDSEPASELAETEVKLQALLPLLTG